MSTEICIYLQQNTITFKLKMGQSQNIKINPFLDSNWVTLTPDTPALFNNVNPFAKRTFRNTTNNEEVEEYLVEFASQFDFKEYTQKIRMRMQPSASTPTEESNNDGYYYSSPYIYTVKYFMNNNLEDMCATIYKGLLYVQKVDLRLKQINDIPLSDQLYFIKATLQGFKLLYQNQGYFDITEEMIFINKEGKVKVWINSNLSKSQPIFIPHNPSKDVHGSQSEMIVQLLDLIEENSDTQQHQGIRFKEYLTKKGLYNRLSFYRALDQFQAYCLQYHLVVEKAMRSIYELYHQDQMELSEVVEQTDNRANNEKIFAKLKVPNKVESKEIISSRISKVSQLDSKSNFNRQRTQDINRPQSINAKQQKKNQEITLHNAKLPPLHNYDNQKAKEQPLYLNHFLKTANIPPAVREMSPVIKIRSPSHTVSRRSSYNQAFQNTRPPVIKFNYMTNQSSSKKIPPQQIVSSKQPPHPVIPQNVMTIKSIRTDSRASTKQMNPSTSEGLRSRDGKKWINYYTSDQTYKLDKEIAQDLQKYLGYDINS